MAALPTPWGPAGQPPPLQHALHPRSRWFEASRWAGQTRGQPSMLCRNVCVSEYTSRRATNLANNEFSQVFQRQPGASACALAAGRPQRSRCCFHRRACSACHSCSRAGFCRCAGLRPSPSAGWGHCGPRCSASGARARCEATKVPNRVLRVNLGRSRTTNRPM